MKSGCQSVAAHKLSLGGNMLKTSWFWASFCWLFFFLVVFPCTIFAGMSSAGYTISRDVMSSSGGAVQSASYTMQYTLGQPSPVGPSSSATYANEAGFWHFLVLLGDLNGDGKVDLVDVIRGLQILTGQDAGQVYQQADINGDGKVGLEELVYALEKTAGQR
jgi:hypothetical protein